VLALVCGALLIAAPLAVVFTGGTDATDGGTGRGGAGVTTESTVAPAPAGSTSIPGAPVEAGPAGAVDAAGDGSTGGGSASGAAVGDAGSGGTSSGGGAGSASRPATAAGSDGGTSTGGTTPGGTSGTTGGGTTASTPAPRPPASPPPPSKDANGVPCPCQIVNGVLTSLSVLSTPPLPEVPTSPLG
jgi:hypothetical protein